MTNPSSNPMANMMPMMMMSQMFGGGSGNPNGGDTPGMDPMQMMMQMMMPGLFEEDTVPLWNDAVAIGTTTDRGLLKGGQLDVQLLPPTMKTSRASLRIVCGNGYITVRPDEFAKLQAFFTDLPKRQIKAYWPGEIEAHEGTLEEIWLEAQQMEDGMREQRMMTEMMSSG